MTHFWPPIAISHAELATIAAEHDRITPETVDRAGIVFDVLGVEYDEDARDLLHCASVIVSLAAELAAMRRAMQDAQDVAPMSLESLTYALRAKYTRAAA